MMPSEPLHRILVADDNFNASESLAILLGLCDYDVRTVEDGEQAIELARQWIPHVAIVDINMPRLNGLVAARVLHAEFPDMLMVALTGDTDPSTRCAAMASGYGLFFVKPAQFRELRLAIAQLMPASTATHDALLKTKPTRRAWLRMT